MKLSNTLVVLDLETTGTWVDRDKIIEIAMIKCAPDGTRETYEKKVNPGMPIPGVVSELTGITNEDVKDAPAFKDIAGEVFAFIEGCDVAGFNVCRFDFPLLQREIYDAGLKVNWEGIKAYDAQKVFHLNEKRDLTAAYNFYCHKDLENAHSALADTQATLEVLEAQVAKYGQGEDALESLGRFDYQTTAEFLDDERKFRWWNGRAYMMFGKYARKHSLQEVARMDPGYLEWILSAKFSEEVKTLVSNALQGRFPVFELKDKNNSKG
ncbi:MAG: 3'-5' exoribonuclease [Candidatus Omnitrophica bacterium]|nr:3'-5' exoribonuclease [Candidatus Omnitrophota bacterium]